MTHTPRRIQPCLFKWTEAGKRYRCQRCGFTDTASPITNIERIHRRCEIPYNPGLGDYVALLLARIGITKRRWAEWKYYLRISNAKNCGICKRRQEQLNRIGDWLVAWWQSVNPFRQKPKPQTAASTSAASPPPQT